MFIRRMRIAQFRHIRDAEIGPLGPPPPGSDLVALVGPNGAGKSSILELLGHALSNSWSLTWSIRRSFPASSFEIDIGLTPNEIALVEERLEAPTLIQTEALEYLKEHRGYARSFSFADGEYTANPKLHNQAHNLVTQALRDHHGRALGFFLRSDRSYPFQNYDQRKLIQNTRRGERKHVWGLAFNTSDIQYQDMYDFLIEQQYHYDRGLGSYVRRQRAEQLQKDEEEPPNPIDPYDNLLGRLFPGYAFAESPDIPDNLYVKIPTGERIAFQDLSSGEKEVFFILSFFLRNDVRDAVVVLDEPELHLHPELGRLLIRTMQEIRPGNQIWVGTHNGEIIDEAGRDRLFFLERERDTLTARVTAATDESEARRLLRGIFGYSGYVGVARAMVFTEGTGASTDRRMFSKLISSRGGAARVIPAGGADSLPRINAAVIQLLNETFSSCEFFLIRDRDYLTDQEAAAMVRKAEGRLWVLARNQIENYLLVSDVILEVEREILGAECTMDEVERCLRQAARGLAGETLRDMLAFRMNRIFAPQDFSLDRMLQGQVCIDENGEWIEAKVEALRDAFSERVASVQGELAAAADRDAILGLFSECQAKIGAAVEGHDWRSVIPGKRLIQEYVRLRGHASALVPALTNGVVKYLAVSRVKLDQELSDILDTVDLVESAAT